MSGSRNFAQENLSTEEIQRILNLYNGEGAADWFLSNVVSPDIDYATRQEIKRNFPRMNYLAWIIDRVAYSMPMLEVIYQPKPSKVKDYEETGDEAADKEGRAAQEEGAKASEAASQAKAEKVMAAIRYIQERQTWEGEKDFWGSVPNWRIFLLLCGDTFVKLPWSDEDKGIMPERMGPQYSKIILSDQRKKKIDGYRFEYPIGSSSYQSDPLGENTRIETITRTSWKVDDSTKGTVTNVKDGPYAKGMNFIPVSHMSFKEREDHPRGLPFANALMDKILHIYAIQLTRRLGNKYNGAPIIIRLNASGSAPQFRPGETHDVHDKSPLHKADVKAVGGGLTLTSTEEEYKDAIKELEDLAFLPHEGREMTSSLSTPSGSASEQLSKSQIAFREGFTRGEGSFYGDLFYKILRLEGVDVERCEITCQYDSVKQPTATQQQAKADTLFDQKFMRQALREMGYEDDQIEKMLGERDEEMEKAVDQFMSGAGKQIEEDPDAKKEEDGKAAAKP